MNSKWYALLSAFIIGIGFVAAGSQSESNIAEVLRFVGWFILIGLAVVIVIMIIRSRR